MAKPNEDKVQLYNQAWPLRAKEVAILQEFVHKLLNYDCIKQFKTKK